MITYKRKCIKSFSFKVKEGECKIKKGKEYITSDIKDNDTLILFDSLGWFTNIPKDIFDEGVLFTK